MVAACGTIPSQKKEGRRKVLHRSLFAAAPRPRMMSTIVEVAAPSFAPAQVHPKRTKRTKRTTGTTGTKRTKRRRKNKNNNFRSILASLTQSNHASEAEKNKAHRAKLVKTMPTIAPEKFQRI
jgi:hypothetical protein